MDAPCRIDLHSSDWPDELRGIDDPPCALFARGRLELLSRRPRAALVGTRSPTAYGESQAARFARALASAGVVVVSGMARGVDSIAHRAALDAGGATVAVLGCGVDRPWPGGELADRLAREGLLLSELPPGTPPRRHHFPRRNRLISGLADVVLVVEAARASGSLITAKWAADQGRTVCALPGRVDHPMSGGCHRLLREGAALVESPDEVLAELALDPLGEPAVPDARASPFAEVLRGETLSADELAERLSRPLSDVLVELVQAELGGAVVRGPGGLYRLAD